MRDLIGQAALANCEDDIDIDDIRAVGDDVLATEVMVAIRKALRSQTLFYSAARLERHYLRNALGLPESVVAWVLDGDA